MNKQPSRLIVVAAACIIGVTLIGKAFAILRNGALLNIPHPFLFGSFRLHVTIAILLELGALCLLLVGGRRVFLIGTLALGISFVSYHGIQSALRVSGPCPCFGGLLGQSSQLQALESDISLACALALTITSFVGLFEFGSASTLVAVRPVEWSWPSVAVLGWVLVSGWIVVTWSGRVIGGDEGLEAAKTLQFVVNPSLWGRVWNDQPALWTLLSGYVFKVFGTTLTVGRCLTVGVCVLLPITVGAYFIKHHLSSAVVVVVVFMFASDFRAWTAFMVEGPVYTLALASWLPVLCFRLGHRSVALSAAIAAFALSIKLTAVFGLLLPFVYLWSRSRRMLLLWCGIAISIFLLATLYQPGWSWRDMVSSHVQKYNHELSQYRLRLDVFADNWLLVALAAVACGVRFLRGRYDDVVPWVIALGVAICIHTIHRPYWEYYGIHMIIPLSVLAAIGLDDIVTSCEESRRPWAIRKYSNIVLYGVCVLWLWRRYDDGCMGYRVAQKWTSTQIPIKLGRLAKDGHKVYSIDPLWTFVAMVPQTPPELTFISLKRHWSGTMENSRIIDLLEQSEVMAIVVRDGYRRTPEWTNFLSKFIVVDTYRDDTMMVSKSLRPMEMRMDGGREIMRAFGK